MRRILYAETEWRKPPPTRREPFSKQSSPYFYWQYTPPVTLYSVTAPSYEGAKVSAGGLPPHHHKILSYNHKIMLDNHITM